MQTIAIVGASLAGLSAARALRTQGYTGRLLMIGDEDQRPYDRPPLSKDFLLGKIGAADLMLEATDEDLGAEWIQCSVATALDPESTTLTLADGSRIEADGIILATGARARKLPDFEDATNAFTLRTLSDACALAPELAPGRRMVVIGAGFIGAEVASSAKARGMDVVVLNSGSVPFSAALGPEMGACAADLHAANGVELICNASIDTVTRDNGRITAITLADGRQLPADVVVLGVGSVPNTDWLAGSGIALGNGILCDIMGRTNRPGIVAVGDCSAWFSEQHEEHRRVEHWTDAIERPALAVAALLGQPLESAPRKAPYFWSDQYGVKIQFAGDRAEADHLEILAGTAAEHNLLAVYYRGEDPVAVLGMNQVRLFTKWRRSLSAPLPRVSHVEPVASLLAS